MSVTWLEYRGVDIEIEDNCEDEIRFEADVKDCTINIFHADLSRGQQLIIKCIDAILEPIQN